MKIERNGTKIKFLAIYATVFYAFVTRSILATTVFHNTAMNIVVYMVIYFSLFYSLLKSFDIGERHIYAQRGFYSLLLLAMVMIYEMLVSDSLTSMRYYSMALLLPLAMIPELKESTRESKIFAIVGVFFAFGCYFNYFFPVAYKVLIKPMFSEKALEGINAVEKIRGTDNYVAGFTSQVGYTSFFLIVCIGAVFCFRKSVFKKLTYPLILFMVGALLLTGKRGPIAFFVIALMLVYFLEGYGKEKVFRVFKIIGILISLFIALAVLAKVTDSDGVKRIYETFLELITSGSVDDAGRTQLHEQALKYFREYPLLGIGWTNFMKMFTLRSTHVHCIYLQLLCETGLIGFSIFIFFFAHCFISTTYKTVITNTSDLCVEASWLRFSLYIQTYFLLYGMTGNPLYDAEETILYFFALGISFLPVLVTINEQENI